jgi:hypothetical protein
MRAFGRSDAQCSAQHSQNTHATARSQRQHFHDQLSLMVGNLSHAPQ